MEIIIDRFEGEYAVVEITKGKMVNMPKVLVPDAKEGDVIKIIVDKGAKQALKEHKSLLPSGIIDVKGSFLSGQVVDIVDQDEQVIAKGIVQYSSLEIMLVKGHQSFEMKKILGNYDYDEIIHANNMVILGGKSNE